MINRKPINLTTFAIPILLMLCLVFIRWQHGVLLFHTLAELFSMVMGVLMLVIVWNTHRFIQNDLLLYLGIGYFWISVLDTWHALTFPGMPFVNPGDVQITLHLWIYTRLIEALLLLFALSFLKRKLNNLSMFIGGGVLTVFVSWASFALEEPIMLTPEGLTSLKVTGEYLIIAILGFSIFAYIRQRQWFTPKVLCFLLASMVLTISAELSFTLYTNFEGPAFVVGHLFKFLSFWMIYQAIVQTTLNEPFNLLAQASSSYDAIPHPAVVVNKQGRVSQVNSAAEKYSGKSAQQLHHQSVHTLFHPQNLDEKNCELCLAIKQGQAVEGLVIAFPDKGEWFLASLSPIKLGDENSGMVQLLTNITERVSAEKLLQASEEKLRLIYSQVPGVVYQFKVDTQGKRSLPYVSPAVEGYIGLSAETVMADADRWFALTYPDDYAELEASIIESMNQLSIWSWQGRFIREDGETVWLRGTSTPERQKDGSTVWNGLFIDITEYKQAEKALRRSQKMEAIGQLSGGVAHDFNNQLAIILGYLDFLKDYTINIDDKEPHQWVETATHASLRCADLTRQLLLFSRSQAQEKTTTNINEALKKQKTIIIRSVTPEVEVEYFLATNLWVSEIDLGEFQDTVLNLVINARDAMPGGGKLLIETRNKTLDASYIAANPGLKPGDYVQLVLSDTGTGMDKETLEHIFEPFFTTKPEGKGTGLGMAMVYGFIKRHNGDIKVYSEPEVGTTIRLYLPRAKTAGSVVIEQSSQAAVLPSGSESILIVDDESDLLQLADHYLSELGYCTYLAKNATEALDILANNKRIDLIFSDVVMPGGMNGYELAQQATQQNPKLKVLLTSGFTAKTIAHTELARFSTHLLTKPYRQIDLAQRIRRVLDTVDAPSGVSLKP